MKELTVDRCYYFDNTFNITVASALITTFYSLRFN